MRPVFPSAVVNWFPVTVSVVSPVSPRASQLKVPAYVPERSVCSAAMLAVLAGAVFCAGICPGSVCPGAGIASAGIGVWSPVAVVLVVSARCFFEVLFFGVCVSAGCVWGVCAGFAGAGVGGSCAFSTRTSPTKSEKPNVATSNSEFEILLRMDVSSRVRYCGAEHHRCADSFNLWGVCYRFGGNMDLVPLTAADHNPQPEVDLTDVRRQNELSEVGTGVVHAGT
jgi:hypothetical protein